MADSQAIVVWTTVSSLEEATRIADQLVADHLAACVNISAPITSVYRWKGEIHRDPERLLIIKTRQANFERLRAAIAGLHSYELPEVIAVPIVDGDPAYLDWLESMSS